jgi:hypothetical protein
MTGQEIRVRPADVAAWDGFAAALAGASAALAGLVFVAVSINIRRILSVPGCPAEQARPSSSSSASCVSARSS